MRRKVGTICMVLGAVLVAAALCLFIYNQRESGKAAEASEQVLGKLVEEVGKNGKNTDPYDPEMTVVEIDGYGYIGYLSIPSLNLELPVMSEWDYERLKIAPCRYSGSTKTNDLVIAGHNYTRHFGPLSRLKPGDAVYFTDMDGKLWSYEVVELDTLQPTAVEEMTSGEFDLTLYTCTYGGKSRVTVRCDQVRDQD